MRAITFLAVLTVLAGCSKPEGKGGGATISGKVYEKTVDHNGKEVATESLVDGKIYIGYGDSQFADADAETNINGEYQFTELRKGSYSIFAYEDCNTCDGNKSLVTTPVEISSNREVKESIDLEILKIVDPDDGNGTLRGEVFIQNYLGESPYQDPYPAQNRDVYLVYNQDSIYFDRIDTDNKGIYYFDNLIQGSFAVYVYSECDTCLYQSESVYQFATIPNKTAIVDVPRITIKKQL